MLQKKKIYLAVVTLSLLSFLPIGPPLISLVSVIPHVHAEDIVVATVNGEPIYKAELDPLIRQFKRKSGNKDATDEDKQQLVTNLTVKKLILHHPGGRALKNDPTISRNVKNYEESLVVDRFIRDYVDANAKVSEDDLRLYYNTHQDQFSVSPKLEARVILLRTREDAAKIRARLLAGEDFAKLAETYSIDLPSARKGGSLGVKQRGEIFPQIWRAIIKLDEGEISAIVETEFGYNILTVDRIVSPEVIKPFNDVRAEIRRSILPRKRDKVYLEMVEKLQRDAKIEIFEDQF